jgi:ferrous iron transport protein A
MKPQTANSSIPLCQLRPGASGRVSVLQGDDDFCQRVREMGFGESTVVRKVSGNTTILCQINGTRIALSHRAAQNILVAEIAGSR